MRSVLKVFHKDKNVANVQLADLDDAHKIIGLMNYGGWINENVKYIIEEYFITSFEDAFVVVRVNVQTEREADEKAMSQFQNLSPSFKEKLVPLFKRNTPDGESIN